MAVDYQKHASSLSFKFLFFHDCILVSEFLKVSLLIIFAAFSVVAEAQATTINVLCLTDDDFD